MTDTATSGREQAPVIQRKDMRLVRAPLPAELIRQVDEIVRHELGGFQTRHEFIEEAVTNLVLETRHRPGGATTGPTRTTEQKRDGRPAGEPGKSKAAPKEPEPPAALREEDVEPFTDFSETALELPRNRRTVEESMAVVEQAPSFGLSNRDYPALLCLQWLVEMSAEAPPSLEDFYDEATRRAWRFGAALAALPSSDGQKLAALFPTNWRKQHAAETGFRSFAIGSLAKRATGGRIRAAGPLFSWGAAGVVRGEDGELRIGPTQRGVQLLGELVGLTAQTPHPRAKAEAFLAYLTEHAPWDFGGFAYLCQVVGEGPDRPKLIDQFAAWHPEWSKATAATNAAGYLARAREWGLVLPKLVDGAYVLSDYGRESFT